MLPRLTREQQLNETIDRMQREPCNFFVQVYRDRVYVGFGRANRDSAGHVSQGFSADRSSPEGQRLLEQGRRLGAPIYERDRSAAIPENNPTEQRRALDENIKDLIDDFRRFGRERPEGSCLVSSLKQPTVTAGIRSRRSGLVA